MPRKKTASTSTSTSTLMTETLTLMADRLALVFDTLSDTDILPDNSADWIDQCQEIGEIAADFERMFTVMEMTAKYSK